MPIVEYNETDNHQPVKSYSKSLYDNLREKPCLLKLCTLITNWEIECGSEDCLNTIPMVQSTEKIIKHVTSVEKNQKAEIRVEICQRYATPKSCCQIWFWSAHVQSASANISGSKRKNLHLAFDPDLVLITFLYKTVTGPLLDLNKALH